MAAAEQKKSYQVIKQFKGLNTKANRTAIDATEFSWLENLMPIGFGNLKAVNGPELTGSYYTATIVAAFGCSIGITDYIIAFLSDGSAQAYNVSTNVVSGIATSNTFSLTGDVSVAQYKNKYVAIVDAKKGYFTWNAANLVKVGSIGRIGIRNPGSGYYSAPTVTIAAPDQVGGTQATAICAITNSAGTVVGITITNIGSGYTSVPSATVAAPPYPGTRATVECGISGGNIVQVSIVNPGSGYTGNIAVSFTGGGGTGAAATAIVDTGSISAVALTNAGSGYTTPPSIVLSGGGGAVSGNLIAELVTFETGTVTINVTDGGYGYNIANIAGYTVSITGGGGSNAAALPIVSGGEITQILMTNAGAGYTSPPTVTINHIFPPTVSAVATAVVNSDENTSIASFSGRIWISQARNVFYSSSLSPTDFTSISAGSITLSDSTLHGSITGIVSANNFLYIFGDDSINVFSDVRVTNDGYTLFTNTNISASIGTSRKNSIFPYFRSLLFMNDYGIYALVGSTTTKISDSLDGIFPYIDFTKPVYAGQVLINNILCATFNFYYTGTGGGSFFNNGRYIQAVFFEKKWFITSQELEINDIEYGGAKVIISNPTGGKISLYGIFDGPLNRGYIYKLYGDPDLPVKSYVQTALLPMEDPIRTKQALKYGIEASNNPGYALNISVDSEQGLGNVNINVLVTSWVNNSQNVVNWTNASSAIVYWTTGAPYYLYKGDAQQWGKYLGLTSYTMANGIIYNTFELEHEMRTRF